MSRAIRGASFAAAALVAGSFSSPAQAADLYKPAYQPPSQYGDASRDVTSRWYLGGLVGYGLAPTDLHARGGHYSFDQDGAIAGGILGWNYISNGYVLGVEGDLLGGGVEGTRGFGPNVADASVSWMLGLRGRAGLYVTPEIMLFGTIGVGWTDMDITATGPGGGSRSEVFSGVQYGGGAEVALSREWSLRMDYIYTDLGSETVVYPGGTVATYDPGLHQFRGGLLYRF